MIQAMESKLILVIAKVNQALDPSDNADAITADKLQSAADELQNSKKLAREAGLGDSNPHVKEATTLGKALHDKRIKLIEVIAVYVVSVFECV